MAIRPWTVEGSRTLLKDRWINLRADDCRLPDGTPVSPFYVNSLPDFVVAVALTEEGDFIFVRQYRHGTGQILLEFPAGCIEESDPDAAHAAARELLEETGYAGNPPVFLCKVAPNASGLSNFAHCYLITGCRKIREQELDATEDMEVELLSAEETDSLLADHGLVQAVHVAAMYYAARALNGIRNDDTRNDDTQNGGIRNGYTQNGDTQNDGTGNGDPKNGGTGNGATQNGSAGNGDTQDGSAGNGKAVSAAVQPPDCPHKEQI